MKKLYTLLLLISFSVTAQMPTELLTDGDFEDNNAALVWTTVAEIKLENNNHFFYADVDTAGDSFSVNLSQNVILTRGNTYTLSFEASTGPAGNTRPLIAGIGQSGAPYKSTTESITITDDNTITYTIDFVASFAGPYRVLFDMGHATGIVVIDNVSLVEKDMGTPAENNVLLEDFSGSPNTETFEGLTSATIEADPVSGGTNGNTLKLITNPDGFAWQGATIYLPAGSYANISTNKTIAVDVYATSAISIMAKVEDENFSSPAAANTQTHTGSGWETLIFTFTTGSENTTLANGTYSKVAIFPNRKADDNGWNDPVVDQTIYIDNIKSTEDAPQHQNGLQDGDETGVDCGGAVAPACPTGGPTDAPPTPPTRDASDVISIYGEAYDTAIGVADVDWDQGSTFSEESFASNNVMKISFNDFIGLELPSYVDASTMTHMHLDIWIADAYAAGQVFKPKWSNHEGENGETAAFDYTHIVTTTDSESWVSIDVAFDDFVQAKYGDDGNPVGNGSADRMALKQLVLSVAATLDEVYVDNIYLYKDATASIGDLDFNFEVYPNPVKDVLNVISAESIDMVKIYDLTGRIVKQAAPNKANFNVDVADLSNGVYLVKLNADNKEVTTKLIK